MRARNGSYCTYDHKNLKKGEIYYEKESCIAAGSGYGDERGFRLQRGRIYGKGSSRRETMERWKPRQVERQRQLTQLSMR